MSLLGRLGWYYRRILGRALVSFQVIPNLRWEMAPRLDSGMIYGMEICSLRKPFQICIALLAQRMLLLRLSWSFLVVPFSGK
jgi:hypothetical protein